MHGLNMAPDWSVLALKSGLLAWIFILFIVFVVKTLRGEISLHGIAHRPGGGLDPERLLLLGVTFAVAIEYFISGLAAAAPAGAPPTMPDLPDEALLIFGGAQSAYLTGKFLR